MQLQAPVEGTGTAVLEELLLHCASLLLQTAGIHPAPTSEEASLPHDRHRRRFGDCGVLGSAAAQVAGSVLLVVPGVARAAGSPGRTDLAHRRKQCSLLRRCDVRFQANRKVLLRDVHPKRRCCCCGRRAIHYRPRILVSSETFDRPPARGLWSTASHTRAPLRLADSPS